MNPSNAPHNSVTSKLCQYNFSLNTILREAWERTQHGIPGRSESGENWSRGLVEQNSDCGVKKLEGDLYGNDSRSRRAPPAIRN